MVKVHFKAPWKCIKTKVNDQRSGRAINFRSDRKIEIQNQHDWVGMRRGTYGATPDKPNRLPGEDPALCGSQHPVAALEPEMEGFSQSENQPQC